MGSDIFESYCGSMIATVAIASTLVMTADYGVIALAPESGRSALMSLPLGLASIGLICSILGILVVRMMSNKSAEAALHMGHNASAVLLIIGSYFLTNLMGISENVWFSIIAGTAGGVLIGIVTQYLSLIHI